jgi:hypothetical protein
MEGLFETEAICLFRQDSAKQLFSRIEGPRLGASVVQELGAARPNVLQIARK